MQSSPLLSKASEVKLRVGSLCVLKTLAGLKDVCEGNRGQANETECQWRKRGTEIPTQRAQSRREGTSTNTLP